MKKRFMKCKNWAALLTRRSKIKRNIHEQIEETIAERKKILPEWEKLFLAEEQQEKRDIHLQLRQTITEFKRAMKQHEQFFITEQNKRAA